MKFYYTDVVLSDIERFLETYVWSGLPVWAYARAKGFDEGLFTNFLAIVESSVLKSNPRSNMKYASGWNRALTYFELTPAQVTQFANILEYYDWIEDDFEQDEVNKKNSSTEFDKRWNEKWYNYNWISHTKVPEPYQTWYQYSGNWENANKELIYSNEKLLKDNVHNVFSEIPTDEDAPKRYPSHYPYYHDPIKKDPLANNTLWDMAGDWNGSSRGWK